MIKLSTLTVIACACVQSAGADPVPTVVPIVELTRGISVAFDMAQAGDGAWSSVLESPNFTNLTDQPEMVDLYIALAGLWQPNSETVLLSVPFSDSALLGVVPEPDSLQLLLTIFAGLGLWQLRKNLGKSKMSPAAEHLEEHAGGKMFATVPSLGSANLRNKVSEAALTCPKCGSSSIRRSKTVGYVVDLFEMFGLWRFRCRACRKRFYRSCPPPEERTPINGNL